jgi:uncharacterized protein (DUF1800 family)
MSNSAKLLVATAMFLADPAHASSFVTLWQLGANDGSLSPFSQESFGPNVAPGSAALKDDDYYFAGVYPSPVGGLASDEAITQFERAVTASDPRNRIHFPLTASQASASSRLRITIDLAGGGAWVNGSLPGFATHHIRVQFNGVTIANRNGIAWDTTLVLTVPASSVMAVTGANVLQIERTGGDVGGYIGFDYLQLEADPVALADTDGDGMPRWFEETYQLNDSTASDAALDPDGDGLTNLQESQAGTNPTDRDTDNDGLADFQESQTGTNPLLADTDGDGIADDGETITNPLLVDTDSDGFPDSFEIEQGSDPVATNDVPYDFPGAIGLQFISEQDSSAMLGRWESAGFIRMPGWNSSTPLPHWSPSGATLNATKNNLADHRGVPTSAAASWSYHFAGDGLHKSNGNARLFNGMIRSERTASTQQPASITLTGIPYATYDLIIYPGYIYPGHRGLVRMDSAPGTNRYFISDSSPPFAGFRQITATTEATIHEGNFVRYRNLTGTNRTITLESLANPDPYANPDDNYPVGIHGIQIIDSATDSDGDGMPDAIELEYRFNPEVADATADADQDLIPNLTEINNGTDAHHPDTDRDGIPDGAEAANGTSALNPDSDGDGLSDGAEIKGSPFPSSPILADSDGDGFSDPTELSHSSDPTSADSLPPSVPIWDGPSRTWRWRIDNLRVLWNHGQSMTGAIDGSETMLCEAVADIDQSGWIRQIGVGIRYRDGRLTHRFRSVEGAFYWPGPEGNEALWDSDWNNPPADRTRDFGFSGSGLADDSIALRFEFTATQPTAGVNLWTLSYVISDLSNPSLPVTLATYTRSNGIAAETSLLTGSTIWKNSRGQVGAIDLYTEPGTEAIITGTAPGTPDADNDGMPDEWEDNHLFDDTNPADAPLDEDNDGLSNLREFLAGTHPGLVDSDGDGASDSIELHHGSDPLLASSLPAWFTFNGTIDDLDGDGLSDSWVLWSGGKPRIPTADDDGDGMSNLEESRTGTNPEDPASRFDLRSWRQNSDLVLSWTDLMHKQVHIESGTTLDDWQSLSGLPVPSVIAGRKQLTVPGVFASPQPAAFFRSGARAMDSDGDGVEDWAESLVLGSSIADQSSLGQPLVRPNQQTLSGDALALLNRLQGSSPSGGPPGSSAPGTPSPLQASRFLMQSTFGPTPESIRELREMGYEAWIDQQILLPQSLLQPYLKEIKADAAGPRTDRTYNFNELDRFVHGNNFTTPFARNAVGGSDQLRQRLALALSQILVVSRRDANLEEKPEAMANYYDMLGRHALGNYGDLLRDVTFHPVMGWYLSSAGNQKADPSIPRYPDENYAREIMQLFTLGLWELNPDGSRKLDPQGEPIPTYDNGDVTELARAFTGMYFASPYGWGGGGWADGHFTQPMVMYPERHDFGIKRLPNHFVIPSRDESNTNATQDILDAVDALFRHPNTPVFVSKQLIQFLVTDNPSPAYIKRVQDVFVNDGSGTRGNLSAVVKAILLDDEARRLPRSASSGKVREPVVRTMHLGRIFRLAETHPDFVWWNWTENFYGATLQEPLNSPSVFNFYTPVYQAPGEIRNQGLVSPGFQIINTYSAVAFPNLLWDYMHDGFRSSWSWAYPLDYSQSLLLAENPAALVDHIDLLVCAGNLSARTRGILLNTLSNPELPPKERVAVAVWTAMNSPEGVIQQ